MAKESTYDDVTSFTGTGKFRVIDDTAGTPRTRKMPAANVAAAIGAATTGDITSAVSGHSSGTTSVHGIADTSVLVTDSDLVADNVVFTSSSGIVATETAGALDELNGSKVAVADLAPIDGTIWEIAIPFGTADNDGTHNTHTDDIGKITALGHSSANTLQVVASSGTQGEVAGYRQTAAGAITVTDDGTMTCDMSGTFTSARQGAIIYILWTSSTTYTVSGYFTRT